MAWSLLLAVHVIPADIEVSACPSDGCAVIHFLYSSHLVPHSRISPVGSPVEVSPGKTWMNKDCNVGFLLFTVCSVLMPCWLGIRYYDVDRDMRLCGMCLHRKRNCSVQQPMNYGWAAVRVFRESCCGLGSNRVVASKWGHRWPSHNRSLSALLCSSLPRHCTWWVL